MILKAIKYIRLQDQPKEWSIVGCDGEMVHFGNINLVVGKNATGKSRTLAVIKEISGLISGRLKLSEIPYPQEEYILKFKSNDDIFDYHLKLENRLVVDEILFVNGIEKLNRTKKEIFSETSQKTEKLVIEQDQIATLLNNPSEYPFLEKLEEWGRTLKDGAFTNQLEKNYFLKSISQLETITDITPVSSSALLHSFWMGKRLFGDKFVNKVRKDMSLLHYPIETVDILEGSLGYGIYVKEDDLDDVTSQREMSQGMFRALSFIIRLNLASMSGISICVLVDDLGEGLDFDRSKRLIDLLISSTANSNIQIFITTNDRYVMNKLPLKYWSIIERVAKKSVFYNYYNSQNIFDDFKYTGLNNFDFLSTDFYLKGFDATEN